MGVPEIFSLYLLPTIILPMRPALVPSEASLLARLLQRPKRNWKLKTRLVQNFGGQIKCIMGNVEVVYKSFGCPQLTSSSCDVRVHFRVARECYFKCECKCCGALSCFIHKNVSRRLFTAKTLLFPKICTLNSCYIEANQQWIGSFPADRCDWLIKSRTGFSSVHTSAVEPESELRPK